MKILRSIVCVTSLALIGYSCSHGRTGSSTELAQNESARALASETLGADGLPSPADVTEFFTLIDKLDLNDPSVEFNDGTGGMSINLEYKTSFARGDFLSRNADGQGDNSAGHPEGQIVAYNLSRALGFSKYYGRAKWYKISGTPLQTLRSLAKKVSTSNKHVLKAKDRVLATTTQSVVEGSISVYGSAKPTNISVLEMSGGANGVFNTSHPIATLIQASGRQPKNRSISLSKNASIAANEITAARMLSTQWLIDALTEQFDRFSGGNIQVAQYDGEYHIAAFDNGGSGVPGWGTGYVKKYLAWTTRFDRNAAEQILAMNRFVNGGSAGYLNYTSSDQLITALGLRSYKSSFKKNLATVAAHIEATVKKHGNDAYSQ